MTDLFLWYTNTRVISDNLLTKVRQIYINTKPENIFSSVSLQLAVSRPLTEQVGSHSINQETSLLWSRHHCSGHSRFRGCCSRESDAALIWRGELLLLLVMSKTHEQESGERDSQRRWKKRNLAWFGEIYRVTGGSCYIFADKRSILDKEKLKRQRCLITLDCCCFQWSVPS